MHQHYSQNLEMQIQKENTYTEPTITANEDNFDELSKEYKIIDMDKVKDFIEEHAEILDYVDYITPSINDYFPNYQKIIEFCEDPESSDLDFMMIYIKGSVFDEDYETLAKFKNEPAYKSKYSKNINGLVCVELW